MLGSWGETPAGTAAFSLYNNDGDIAFSIVLDSAGHANLTLRDAGGSPLLVLTSIDGGDPGDPASTWRTGQILVGGSDKVLVSIGATSKATGSLATFDRQGRQLVAVTATEGGQGAVETTRRSYSETGRLHTGQVSAPQPPPEPGPAVWTSRPWHTRWRSARSSR